MKFSIRLKIVAMATLISVSAATFAIIFSHFQYEKKARDDVINKVDDWLTYVESSFADGDSGSEQRATIENTVNYILEKYNADPEGKPEEGISFKNKVYYYKNRFPWVYAIEGIGMYHFTDEERMFRDEYAELTYILRDAKAAAYAKAAYIMYFDEERNHMITIADDLSYTPNLKEDAYFHFPGSFADNMVQRPEKTKSHYNYNEGGLLRKCIPVGTYSDANNTLCYFMIEYDFNLVKEGVKSVTTAEIIALSVTSVAMIVLFALLSHFVMVKNLEKLSTSADRFTNNLKSGEKLEVEDTKIKTNDEIGNLNQSFISMEKEIIDYIEVIKNDAKEREKREAELSIASKIQLDSLPEQSFADKNVAIYSFIKAAKEVGGDFYDYYYLDDNHFVITICDVSGKGVPAALFMMKGKELVKANLKNNSSLEQAMYIANNELVRNNTENLFITAFVGIIDFKKKEISYVNAGHEKPYILSNGEVIKLEGTSNFVLGGVEDFEYTSEKASFSEKDRIFLFTDGLNESINTVREEFGYSRIENILKDNINLGNEQLVTTMLNHLSAFVGDVEAFDDVTILVAEIKEKNKKVHLHYEEKDYSIIEDAINRFNDEFKEIDTKTKSEIGIIFDEMLNNYVSYIDEEKVLIDVDIELNDSILTISFTTNGKKFDPLQVKEKYHKEYHDELALGGFGIALVKNFVDDINYVFKNNLNVLKMRKKI